MKAESKIPCISCGKELDNWEYENRDGTKVEVHPMCGLHFRTYGHYGSTVFDPMNGTYLDIAICDECLTKNLDKARGNGANELKSAIDYWKDTNNASA
jgi:hypothetical protein